MLSQFHLLPLYTIYYPNINFNIILSQSFTWMLPKNFPTKILFSYLVSLPELLDQPILTSRFHHSSIVTEYIIKELIYYQTLYSFNRKIILHFDKRFKRTDRIGFVYPWIKLTCCLYKCISGNCGPLMIRGTSFELVSRSTKFTVLPHCVYHFSRPVISEKDDVTIYTLWMISPSALQMPGSHEAEQENYLLP